MGRAACACAAALAVTSAARPTAVAGSFYPRQPERLWRHVRDLLDAAPPPGGDHVRPPKAIIAPHAGYSYSGPIAATAYASLAPAKETVKRVILAGPAHFWPVPGVAVPAATAFDTPLGPVAVDDEARTRALDVSGVEVDDRPYDGEHSLEVQLPFVVAVLGEVSVLPLLVGRSGAGAFADVLDVLWGGSETCFVVSTDLSHYHDAAVACALDRRTAERICRLEAPAPAAACGSAAVAGLLLAARRHALGVRLLELRNSADTCGDPERVVGYGAFALFEPEDAP